MTRVRGTDKLDPPSTYQRIIERGPWASYARCDECGADAGRACRDMDDREALEVCDGRRLVIRDSASRTRGSVRERQDDDDATVPCAHCGEPLPRLGGQSRWCLTRECQAARAARDRALYFRRRGAQPMVTEPGACDHCGEPLPVPRQPSQRACGSVCRNALWRAADRARRQAAAAAIPPPPPPTCACWWCGAALAIASRGVTPEHPCCGDRACKRAISRDRRIKARAALQRDDPAAAE